jgi:hypothetical protein
MGHYVSHPHAIQVAAENGLVILEGPILSTEVQDFVRRVKKVRGLRAQA